MKLTLVQERKQAKALKDKRDEITQQVGAERKKQAQGIKERFADINKVEDEFAQFESYFGQSGDVSDFLRQVDVAAKLAGNQSYLTLE